MVYSPDIPVWSETPWYDDYAYVLILFYPDSFVVTDLVPGLVISILFTTFFLFDLCWLCLIHKMFFSSYVCAESTGENFKVHPTIGLLLLGTCACLPSFVLVIRDRYSSVSSCLPTYVFPFYLGLWRRKALSAPRQSGTRAQAVPGTLSGAVPHHQEDGWPWV